MRKKLIAIIAMLAISSISLPVLADDLSTIYKQALANDPSYKASEASYLATKEKLPISIANLLPNISAAGSISRIYNSISRPVNQSIDPDDTVSPITSYDNQGTYGLTLLQPIFNYSYWMSVKNASANVKQAEALYSSAAQDLMLRTSSAYFSVLQANEVLKYTHAEKIAVKQDYEMAQQRYEVGIIPITGVYQAKARYDLITSNEITASNDLANKREKLREIIGISPASLAGLGSKLPLLNPDPADVNAWMTAAEKQNYTLMAAHYAAIAAQENIKVASAGHLPILNAQGNFQYESDSNSGQNTLLQSGSSHSKTASIGLNLSLPIYQGGLINAQVRQANYQYQQASAQQEQTHRLVISQTRQAFLGVFDAISKIKADQQAIISNESSLKATEASYKFGTMTMVDVLDAEANLYEAQKNYAQDRYNYITQSLTLKQQTGTLSVADLESVNQWLQSEVSLFGESGLTSNALENKYQPSVSKSSYKYKQSPVNKINAGNKKSKTKSTMQKPVLSPKTKPAVTATTKSGANNYLLSLNKQHYTLQLLADNNEKTITNFMHEHASSAKMFYLSVKQGNKTWYKLFSGDYASLSDAQSAKTKLSNELGLQGIWIRKISSLSAKLQ